MPAPLALKLNKITVGKLAKGFQNRYKVFSALGSDLCNNPAFYLCASLKAQE
jgi:hypothetical protein